MAESSAPGGLSGWFAKNRESVAYHAPTALAVLVMLPMFANKPPLSQFLYALFGGVMIVQVGALMAYLLAAHFIGWIAGRDLDGSSAQPGGGAARKPDLRLAAAALLAVGVYGLGQHWKRNQVDQIVRCLEEQAPQERAVAVARRETLRGTIEWCAEEWGAEQGSSADDDY